MVVTPGGGDWFFNFAPQAIDKRGKVDIIHHYELVYPVDLDKPGFNLEFW